MSNFAIIADSTCDLNDELRKRINIDDIVYYSITFPDGSDHIADLNFKCISEQKFYETYKKSGDYKSGAPSPERFIEVFEKYLKEDRDILYVGMSSKISGAFNFSNVAKEILEKKYPNRKIMCLDSKAYSTAICHLLICALELRSKNKTIEETFDFLSTVRYFIHQTGPMDDLMFLAKLGRISNAKAFLGKIVGVNPIGEITREGISEVLVKVKGYRKSLNATVKYLRWTSINPEKRIFFIAHSNRLEKALELKKMIEDEIHPKEVIITPVGLSCAANIGPGLCAVFYFGYELTNNLQYEREVYQKIVKSL